MLCLQMYELRQTPCMQPTTTQHPRRNLRSIICWKEKGRKKGSISNIRGENIIAAMLQIKSLIERQIERKREISMIVSGRDSYATLNSRRLKTARGRNICSSTRSKWRLKPTERTDEGEDEGTGTTCRREMKGRNGRVVRCSLSRVVSGAWQLPPHRRR